MLNGELDFGTQLPASPLRELAPPEQPERRDQPEPAGPWYLRADPWRHVGSGNPQNPFNDQVELWELESSLEPDDESGDEQPHT